MALKIAHRGCSENSLENSLESFKKIVKMGIDAVEFDVRFTKDNEVIIMHDRDIKRTTNGEGLVKDFTFKEIKKFHLIDNSPIPLLQQVFEILKNKSICKIHLKEKGIETEVLRLIKKNNMKNSIITGEISSTIREIKQISPEIRTELGGFDKRILIEKIIKQVKNADADIIGINYNIITKKFVEEAHKNNLEVHIWPVNTKNAIDRMKKINVDGITSMCPEKI